KRIFLKNRHLHQITFSTSSNDDPYDEFLSRSMQTGAALLTCSAQIRTMRVLFRNPEVYAAHMQCDHPDAIAFKTTKTIPALQHMLTQMIIPTTNHINLEPAAPYSSEDDDQEEQNEIKLLRHRKGNAKRMMTTMY
ncbi:hypothetical protein QZH41_018771, partial [Actinostola sp. cb2023]